MIAPMESVHIGNLLRVMLGLKPVLNALRACLENGLQVAQATRLGRPATRRTERERPFEPMSTAFSLRCPRQFRSAGRRPGRAGRPRHPFSKQALSAIPPPGLAVSLGLVLQRFR